MTQPDSTPDRPYPSPGPDFSTQPTGPSFSAQPPGGGYAAQPPGGGYAAQAPAGGYTVPHSGGGYALPPGPGGYAPQPTYPVAATWANPPAAMPVMPYGMSGQQPPAPPPVPPRPESITAGVYAMVAGAAISFMTPLVVMIIGDLKAAIMDSATPGLESYASASYGLSLTWLFVISTVKWPLWLWMAWKVWQGRTWARIVATVLFALGALSALQVLLGGVGSLVLMNLAGVAAGLVAIILIYRPQSSAYLEAMRIHTLPRNSPAYYLAIQAYQQRAQGQ